MMDLELYKQATGVVLTLCCLMPLLAIVVVWGLVQIVEGENILPHLIDDIKGFLGISKHRRDN